MCFAQKLYLYTLDAFAILLCSTGIIGSRAQKYSMIMSANINKNPNLILLNFTLPLSIIEIVEHNFEHNRLDFGALLSAQ